MRGITGTHNNSTTAVIKDPADFAWAHAAFTSKPVGVVDLKSQKITDWAIALLTVEAHSSVDLHPADVHVLKSACAEVRATGSKVARKMRMRPAGIGVTFWYDCETLLIPVNGLDWGLLEITTPCTSTIEPVANNMAPWRH